MIGKDEFGNLRLRERRKGGERLCICRHEVIISLWCEELVTENKWQNLNKTRNLKTFKII